MLTTESPKIRIATNKIVEIMTLLLPKDEAAILIDVLSLFLIGITFHKGVVPAT